MIRALLVAALAGGATVTLAGCGAGSDPNAKPLMQAEAAVRALDRAVGIQTAFVTVGNVDTGATPAIIASALANRVMSEAAGCVSATASDNMLHADFGGGCALATASMHAGGTVDVDVEPDMATGGVTLTFTLAATVDGAALAGDLVVSTPDGNAFGYATDGLTLDGVSIAAPLVVAGIGGGGATLDVANGTVDGAAAALTGVHERFAACYPDDGAAMLGTFDVTFANDTPETGDVTVGSSTSATLPKRAGCPN